MRPTKTMVVDCPSQKPLPLRRDWYPGATWIHGLPQASDFRRWLDGLDGLDVVYTAETGYGRALWDEAERAGVRTVLHANYEFLDRRDRPTVWAAPSRWHLADFPRGTEFLPVPIQVAAPADFPTPGSATSFVHVVGRPAIHDRNGTADVLRALQHVKTKVTVTIRCQEPGYVPGLVREHQIKTPGNVTLTVDTGDVPNNTDLYAGQHVLIMPRRFGGLSLPVNEALGAGMPVIMTDISPNNAWLPAEWLVPATHAGQFRAKTTIDYYSADRRALAAKIDQHATDAVFHKQAATDALRLRNEYSWATIAPRYREVLTG